MTYFIRTEDGTTSNVTKEVALTEVNRCMMDGKREVAEMTAVTDYYMIWYKDGRRVTLSRQTGDMPADSEGRRVITVKGKLYVAGPIVAARPRTPGAKAWIPEAYAHYWSGGLTGQPSGPTRSASASMKPGTVGRAVWDSISGL